MAEYKHQPKSMTKYLYHNRSLEIKNCPLCNFKFTEKKIKLNKSVKGDICYSCSNCLKFSFIDHHNKVNNYVNYLGLRIDNNYYSYTKLSNGKICFSESSKIEDLFLTYGGRYYVNNIQDDKFDYCESFKTMKEVVEFLSTIVPEEYFKNMRLM